MGGGGVERVAANGGPCLSRLPPVSIGCPFAIAKSHRPEAYGIIPTECSLFHI